MQQAALCLQAPLHSCPLGLSAQSSHTAVLWASVLSAATTPASALLQPCSRATVSPRALGRALYIESITMHCPHMCSELANQGQVRILATGTFILSTLHLSRILSSQSMCPQSSAVFPVQGSRNIVIKLCNNIIQYTNNKNYNKL